MSDMIATNPIFGAMLAGIDSFWVALVIIIGSSIYNWLQKRKGAGNDQEPQPPLPAGRKGQTPTRTQQPAPRQSKSVSWEEELRRLLEGDAPVAPPLPLIIVEKKPPATVTPPAPARARPMVEESSPAPVRPLVTLSESASAHQRVEQLNKRVEAHMGRVASMAAAASAFQKASGLDVAIEDRMSKVTGQHVAQAAVVQHKAVPPDVAQVVALFRGPRTARQAIIASLILGPPRGLEEQPAVFKL